MEGGGEGGGLKGRASGPHFLRIETRKNQTKQMGRKVS